MVNRLRTWLHSRKERRQRRHVERLEKKNTARTTLRDHDPTGGQGGDWSMKERISNTLDRWRERRQERRLAQADAKKSLRDEPSKARRGAGKGTGLPPGGGPGF
jgi:hypothetical protein